MRVLIVPEDPTNDQYILKPVVERIFADLGRRATVEVLRDPHLRGVSEALDKTVLEGIVADNRMVDLFLVIADRDCDRLGASTKAAAREADFPGKVLVCLAEQEAEVWALALYRAEISAAWGDVRAECDPKELYFDAFVRAKGWDTLLGEGRKHAMRALAGASWRGFKAACTEIETLQQKIGQLI